MKKKHTAFLKLIIGYKSLMGVVELILAIGFLNFFGQDLEEALTGLAESFNLDTDNRIISAAIDQAGMIGNGTLIGITCIIFAFGVFNLVEAYGLHLRQRWAEWLTVIATSLLIPFEVYEVAIEVSVLKLSILVINILIVFYLAKHKELFKGKRRRKAVPAPDIENIY